MKQIAFFFLSFSLLLGGVSYAVPASEFAKNNPDIQKYEYVRSFIAALVYIKAVHERWHRSSPVKDLKGAKDVTVMRGFLSYLIKDNADLRVAKNYIAPYLNSPNALIKKSADSFIVGCNTVIGINDKEKQIWDQWNAIKSTGLGSRKNETAFLDAQVELALKRKEAFKNIIAASVMLTKILRSASNVDEKGKQLAITAVQRKRLLKSLDEVGKTNLDWGLKPGQTFHQASVAVLREILEDPIYKSLP